MSLQPFHLAVPVADLAEARAFYGGLLGCPEGRSSPEWVDFDFFGHQLVAHLDPDVRRPQRGGRQACAGAALRRGAGMAAVA
jgi:extradiol dioxygenase family protein